MIYHDFINTDKRFVEYQSGGDSVGTQNLASQKSALAPVLGARKNGTASASSARGLLLTLLGELVLTNDGRAWTQTLIEALKSLDVEEKAARQAIGRIAERGWLQAHKVGRRSRWSLTPDVQGLLEDGASRIYGFGRTEQIWNGEWVLVTASVPERNRAVRYQLTSSMSWAGFGSLGQGWWISPRPEREPEAHDALSEANISDANSFLARNGSMGEPRELANRAWDLDAVREAYDRFLDLADELERRHDRDTPLDAVRDLIQLVHEWRRFPFLDPDLPAELLPLDWPGERATKRFHELHAAWSPLAQSWWQGAERTYDR